MGGIARRRRKNERAKNEKGREEKGRKEGSGRWKMKSGRRGGERSEEEEV